ncbi:hypothetical protein TNCV_3039761 [Trichonephila clavipes]|uniref:Uncharacterized protein n=1 Tax=Trichonephila clavipes TaxID=2585209 RepID=A0A8X6RY26_TRICX|nr:hypothetical protein TNCV_3039761 [Trichonephila clavipes]
MPFRSLFNSSLLALICSFTLVSLVFTSDIGGHLRFHFSHIGIHAGGQLRFHFAHIGIHAGQVDFISVNFSRRIWNWASIALVVGIQSQTPIVAFSGFEMIEAEEWDQNNFILCQNSPPQIVEQFEKKSRTIDENTDNTDVIH